MLSLVFDTSSSIIFLLKEYVSVTAQVGLSVNRFPASLPAASGLVKLTRISVTDPVGFSVTDPLRFL